MTIREPIKNVGKQTFLYGIGNISIKIVAFLLIPVYTKFLPTRDVGIIALIELSEIFLIATLHLGVYQGLWRYLPDCESDSSKSLISSGFWGVLVTDLLILTVLYFLLDKVLYMFGLGMEYIGLFRIMLFNVFMYIGIQYTLQLWRYEQKVVRYIIVAFIQLVGIVSLIIMFVIKMNYGILGVLLGKTLVLVPLFLFMTFTLVRNNFFLPSVKLFIKQIKFGLPLVIVGISTPILTMSDRYFLNMFVSLDQVGIYNIVYKFAMLINMFLVVPLGMGLNPIMYRLGLRRENHDFFRDIMFYYGVVGGVMMLSIVFFSPAVIEIITTPEYLVAVGIIPLVTLGYYINGFKTFFTLNIALKDRTSQVALVAIFGIIINLLLNYFLVKYFYIKGAALSTLLSYLAVTVLMFLVSNRSNQIDWNLYRIGKLFLTLIISYFLFEWLKQIWPHYQIALGFAGIGIFLLLLIITKTLGPREINGIKSLLIQIRNRGK